MYYIMMTSCTQFASIINLCPRYSKAVIGVGIEDEDRMDQWIEDAESVSKPYHTFI
jgi:hypothetical protein